MVLFVDQHEGLTMVYDDQKHKKSFMELNDQVQYRGTRRIIALYVTDADLPGRLPHSYWITMIDGERVGLTLDRDRAYPMIGDYHSPEAISGLVDDVKAACPEITVLGYTVVEVVDLNIEHNEYKEWSYES